MSDNQQACESEQLPQGDVLVNFVSEHKGHAVEVVMRDDGRIVADCWQCCHMANIPYRPAPESRLSLYEQQVKELTQQIDRLKFCPSCKGTGRHESVALYYGMTECGTCDGDGLNHEHCQTHIEEQEEQLKQRDERIAALTDALRDSEEWAAHTNRCAFRESNCDCGYDPWWQRKEAALKVGLPDRAGTTSYPSDQP